MNCSDLPPCGFRRTIGTDVVRAIAFMQIGYGNHATEDATRLQDGRTWCWTWNVHCQQLLIVPPFHMLFFSARVWVRWLESFCPYLAPPCRAPDAYVVLCFVAACIPSCNDG